MEDLTYGGLKYHARALGAVKAHSGASRFLLATQSVVEPNQVHLVEHNEEDEELVCINVYPHAHPVTCLAACPSDEALLLTAYTALAAGQARACAALWRLGGDEVNATLEQEAQLPRGADALLWEETTGDTLYTLDADGVHCWDAATCTQERASLPLGPARALGGLSSNPHFPSVVAACVGDAIVAWDVREPAQAAWSIEGADRDCMRDVDFNPNRPYFLCGGGDEGCVKFWDYRKADRGPVGQLERAHTHWVSAVAYNPHHDSLVLSAGTDGAVQLHSASSVSSAPVMAAADGQANAPPAEDYLISSYDAYSRSVYACCWSSFDTWVYAHLCYDGKAVVSAVSEEEKMKILAQ